MNDPSIQSHSELRAEIMARMADDSLADDAAFSELSLRIFHFQVGHNLPYRRYCESLGRLRPNHWTDIPAVPADAFKHADLFCFDAAQAAKCFLTSGTTREVRGRHFFLDTTLYDESIRQGWRRLEERHPTMVGLDRFALTQSPTAAPQSSLCHMMGALVGPEEERYFLADGGSLRWEAIRALAHGRPVLLMGTALAFLHLIERLDGARLPLPAGSWCLETGGYKGATHRLTKAELYERIRDSLGVPPERVINEYGMTELSAQCYTTGLDAPHWRPPWARVRVLHPETAKDCGVGETGYVQVMDLANLASVSAIATRDLARQETEGFTLLGRDPRAVERGCSRAADEMLRAS